MANHLPLLTLQISATLERLPSPPPGGGPFICSTWLFHGTTVSAQPCRPNPPPPIPIPRFWPALGEVVDACEMRACLTRYCTPSLSQVATGRVTLPGFPVWYLAALPFLLGELRGMEMRGDCCVVRMACTSTGLYGALHLCFLPELGWPQLDDLAARVRWTPTLIFYLKAVTSTARTRTRTEHRLKLRLRHRNGRPKWIDR
ncbi:hypothetical protein V8C43DRAFT_298179 [Trichoderma afarasin]